MAVNCEISVLLPGLLGPQPAYETLQEHERPALPVLVNWLSRADVCQLARRNGWETLFDCFGIDTPQAADLPFAAIGAVCDGAVDSSGWWLRADPVYLQVDRDGAVLLLAGDEMQLDQHEADELATWINRHYADDGIELLTLHPQRWYLRLAQPEPIRTTALMQVMGQNVQPWLPVGEAQQRWHGIINEMQMLLFNHPCNQSREDAGKVAVNSLWLWGGSHCPPRPARRWQCVYSDDAEVKILAQFCHTPCLPLASLANATLAGKVLVVDHRAGASADLFDWLGNLQRWNNELFPVLQQQLGTSQCAALTLNAADGREFRITAASNRRWWRRHRKLESFLSHD